MAFKDKAREAALQAKSSAQQIAQQGQQKLATVQKQRAETELLRALGTAVYDEHRNSGNHQAVVSALAKLDAHHSAAGDASPSDATEFPEATPQPFSSMPPPTSPPVRPPPVPGDEAP